MLALKSNLEANRVQMHFVLPTTLQLGKTNDKDPHVLSVDLIKAFSTANHELLLKLLKKQGAQEPLVDVVKRLHEASL